MSRKTLNWTPDPEFADDAPNVVLVDIAKLDALWQRNCVQYVGLRAENSRTGKPERYEGFKHWLQNNLDTPIRMPVVSFDERSGGISFTNGRHRVAVLRDSGVQTIPVQAFSAETAEKLSELCGARDEVSSLPNNEIEDLDYCND
jgi:hypothetical protein